MDLRPAGPADAALIAELHAASWRRHYRGAFADFYLDGDVITERRAVWSSRLAAPGAGLTLLAEAGAELIGFIHIEADHDERWGSFIDNLHVRHDRQRSGVGRALMAAAAEAVEHRARYLWVLEQNVAAQGFYRALGGRCVEKAVVSPPGGVAGRLHGTPHKLRFVWP
ncbi:N-acetyltransferase family protein [Actinoplanes sp. CA-051413]|uniref:GNAT family N-acetyltransferase n=1 Tax=Actinoplanes sp. CA-051413 TaxID=3239899 RepID=UPI003D96361F